VKNSAEFAQEVRDMELSEEDVMLSFDVVSCSHEFQLMKPWR